MAHTCSPDDDLPFDEGAAGYRERKLLDANPYEESDWRHREWYLGWSDAEECDPTSPYDHSTESFKDTEVR